MLGRLDAKPGANQGVGFQVAKELVANGLEHRSPPQRSAYARISAASTYS